MNVPILIMLLNIALFTIVQLKISYNYVPNSPPNGCQLHIDTQCTGLNSANVKANRLCTGVDSIHIILLLGGRSKMEQ